MRVLNLRKVQTKGTSFFILKMELSGFRTAAKPLGGLIFQENALFLLKKYEIAAFVLVDKSGYFYGCGGRIRTNDLRVVASRRLAVPEKCCGLTLILAFFDRCRNCGFPSSATGGGNPQFPRARGRLRAAEGISTREKRATFQALLGPYNKTGSGRRHLIRPSVRTGAPSPPGEGVAGRRGRRPLQS